MATVLGYTTNGTPIAAWMFQANPKRFDVAAALADPPAGDDWTWTVRASGRLADIGPGQPAFLWVSENDHPSLPSGLWLAGQTTGPATTRAYPAEPRPRVPLALAAIGRVITRAELLDHPVLQHLEVLRTPHHVNPLVVTPEQLDALRAEFDLTPTPLDEALRMRLRPQAHLWLLGEGPSVVEVRVPAREWLLERDGQLLGTHGTCADAYAAAAELAHPTPPGPEDDGSRCPIAQKRVSQRVASVCMGPDGTFDVVVTHDRHPEHADLVGDPHPTFVAAVQALAHCLDDALVSA